MDVKTHYDVIIIGSGAGGATVAHGLAAAGKKILILERGQHLARTRFNWDSKYVFVDRRYRTTELWYDKDDRPFHPNTHYWVGGNTTFYGAALFRLRPGDFEQQQHAGGGVSPAWPVKYAELVPWYQRAEKLWRVRGKRGVDPSEPGGEEDYALPPIQHDPTVANLEAHFRKLGWRPFPMPLGIDRNDADPETSPCIRCVTCGGYPCLVKAKSDARTIALDPLKGMENVTLLTGRKVLRIDTDATGRTARRVLAETETGDLEGYFGDIIVLAAGAVNTAAILFNSRNEPHPEGLANGSDQVGRNYMFHTMSAMISVTATKVDADFPKTLAVNDFYWRDPDGSFDHPMGHIQLLEHMEGHVLEGQVKEEGVDVSFIPAALAEAAADRMLAFLCISEDLPSPDNRVRVIDGRIHLDYTHGDTTGHRRLVAKLDQAMDGFDDGGHPFTRHHFQITKRLPLYGTAHMCGTARMGDDPRTSVVDRNCRAWDIDNLYITDASVFPSSAAVNPTLTIVANAMRVAEVIARRLGGTLAQQPSPVAPARIEPVLAEAAAPEPRRRSLWPFGR